MHKEYIEERDGGYYVAGTRISLDSIVTCFHDGLSPESILEEFDSLTLAQVYGAITHYLENRAEVDAYRVRQSVRFKDARRRATALPASLQERIELTRERLRTESARP